MIELQFLACIYDRRVARRQRCRSNANVKFTAAPGDDSFISETQLQTAESDFKAGCRFLIADEQICDPQGKDIQRAA